MHHLYEVTFYKSDLKKHREALENLVMWENSLWPPHSQELAGKAWFAHSHVHAWCKITAEQLVVHVRGLFIVRVHSVGHNGVKRADEGETADRDRRFSKRQFLSEEEERHICSITSLQAKLQRQFPLSEADRAATSLLRVHDTLQCQVRTPACKHWLLPNRQKIQGWFLVIKSFPSSWWKTSWGRGQTYKKTILVLRESDIHLDKWFPDSITDGVSL